MSSLLRHPAIVPSLFSDGLDGDACPQASARVPWRALSLVMQSLSAFRQGRVGELRHRGSAVAVGGLALVVVGGKPLVLALALLASGAPR